MMQYFTEILKTFSIAQRIWALIILCISVFFITFGSDIIDTLKPDPTQQNLVVQRQKKEIISLNTQLDSLTLKVGYLTQEVINGQSECSNKRIQREKEIITQIDELQNMLRSSSVRPKTMVKEPEDNGLARDEVKVIQIDNTDIVISALGELKNKIKNKK
jgi:hypothetical protein